jgi:hypothetical protein
MLEIIVYSIIVSKVFGVTIDVIFFLPLENKCLEIANGL